MSTNTPLSRIARQLTLRRTEVTAVSATVLAFALTVLLEGGTALQESNRVAVELVDHLGWTGTGVVFLAGEAAFFAFYRRIQPHYPRSALAGGVSLAAIGIADVLANVRGLATVGLPETMLWAPVVESAGVVALVGVVLLARPSVSTLREIVDTAPRPSSRTRQVAGSIALVLLLLTSLPAPFADLSVSGEVSAAAEEDYIIWGTEKTNRSDGSVESSTSAPWGGYPVSVGTTVYDSGEHITRMVHHSGLRMMGVEEQDSTQDQGSSLRRE